MDMTYEDFLEHHGIKGQKWGERKYQYEDGSLTPAGRVHYGVGKARDAAVTAVKKVAKATGNVAKKVAIATGHGVAKAGKATAHKVGEIHEKRKAEKREQKIREWSTDLETLQKHEADMTSDEFREALARANMSRQLSDLKKAELDRGLSYLKSAADATGNTLTIANNLSRMITGKSFEDIRKSPSESDKIKLETEKTRLAQEQEKLHQAEVASRNAESQARDKENLEEYNKKVREEAYNKTHYKNQLEAETSEREYKEQRKLWDSIDEAKRAARDAEQKRIRDEMNAESLRKESERQAAETQRKADRAAEQKRIRDEMNAESRRKDSEWKAFEQKLDAERKRQAAVEKAAETRSANSYRKTMRGTQEYKAIFNRLEKAYGNTMEDYYKNQGDSTSEAKRKAKEYVERLADKWLDDELSLSVFDDPDYLEHHGIKGQRWGVRRYQNVDGSLTEEGKMHRLKYITRETEKNNAYYSKYESKYQKLADKAKDEDTRAQYLAMKADATKSKNQVNEYLKNMSMDEILANEKESRDKVLSTAGKVAKVGLMGISMAGGVAGVAAGVRAGVAGATMAASFLSNPENQAALVNNAMKYAEMGIRTAVDIKQWAAGVVIDEVANNIGRYTNPEDFRTIGETAGKAVKALTDGFSSQAGDAVSKATEKVTEAAARGAARAVEEHGGDAGSAALKVAADLARETARTSGDVASDVATTAENVNDIVTMITNAADKVKHSADQDPNFLAHHGIKGQRWGIRRFQNEDGSLTNAGRERYGSSFSERRAHIKETEKQMLEASVSGKTTENVDHHAKDNTWKKKAKLALSTAYAVGYTATGVVITATGAIPLGALVTASGASMVGANAVELAKVGLAESKTKKFEEERAANENVDKKTGLKLKTSELSEKEDMKRVNPGFNNWNTNTKSNCMLCTTAYEMRRRGYDVAANTASIGYLDQDVARWFPGAKAEKISYKRSALDNLGVTNGFKKAAREQILSQGEGARGNIMVRWKKEYGGGGHSMAYEVRDGKLVIHCAQSNKTWNNAQILDHCESGTFARLDNLNFDPKLIKEAVG